MTHRPTALRIENESELVIEWDDGQATRYMFRMLRDACPCATCREKRRQPPADFPILTAAEAEPLRVDGMQPVGNYAYSIQFSDGHNTGIYTFEYLRQLGALE